MPKPYCPHCGKTNPENLWHIDNTLDSVWEGNYLQSLVYCLSCGERYTIFSRIIEVSGKVYTNDESSEKAEGYEKEIVILRKTVEGFFIDEQGFAWELPD